MADYSALYPDIYAKVPGCSDMLIEREVVRAAITFFRDTEVWRVDIVGAANVTGSAHSQVFIVDGLPLNTRLSQVISLSYKGDPLTECQPDVFEQRWPEFRSHTPTGTPAEYTLREEDTVNVMPAPTSEKDLDAFKGRGIVIPKTASESFPDRFYDQYEHDIVQLALSRLYLTPQHDWTNVQLGREIQNTYKERVAEIRRERRNRRSSARVAKMKDGYGGLLN